MKLLFLSILCFVGSSLSLQIINIAGSRLGNFRRNVHRDDNGDGIPTSSKNSVENKFLNQLTILRNIGVLGVVASSLPSLSKSEFPVYGTEDIMKKKSHGTSDIPVQDVLRWNCDTKLADRICNYNRNWAEFAGYWRTTKFLTEVDSKEPITFYDSVTGLPLFVAPKGRTFEDFINESTIHGWPSFRDQEVVWENVRVLRDGETVSTTGTHLGHNLPDSRNRYCINLVSVAGYPKGTEGTV